MIYIEKEERDLQTNENKNKTRNKQNIMLDTVIFNVTLFKQKCLISCVLCVELKKQATILSPTFFAHLFCTLCLTMDRHGTLTRHKMPYKMARTFKNVFGLWFYELYSLCESVLNFFSFCSV